MATLKEIAQEAGVSVMTVSRVINKRYGEVSEENIRKIQEIIDRLGYVPNYSARNLSSKSSNIISILIQGTETPLSSPYNASMLNYIIQGIQDRGFNTMVHFVSDYSEVTQHLQSWRAQGAIFFGTFDKDMQKIQTSNPMPLVFTDSYSNMRQVINIGIDDYKGGVLAAKHFIEKGHTAFSFVSSYIEDSKVMAFGTHWNRMVFHCPTATSSIPVTWKNVQKGYAACLYLQQLCFLIVTCMQ